MARMYRLYLLCGHLTLCGGSTIIDTVYNTYNHIITNQLIKTILAVYCMSTVHMFIPLYNHLSKAMSLAAHRIQSDE